ncbi:MAG: ATP12 family chaperone protein [Paracoccaceae bacterium]
MSQWSAKRFWTLAQAVETDGGFTVHLDARPVRTPAKAAFILPTLAMAQAAADEWQAQTGKVRPDTMPVTRAANSAIDKVTPLHGAVVAEVAGFGATDLLCYRATFPQALIERQSALWDPLLHWAASALNAPLQITHGVIPIAQPQASIDALTARVAARDPFRLMALHDLVAISGSLLLGLAVTSGQITALAAWDACRIDENWQSEQWGEDEEAAVLAELRKAAFLQADRFSALCGEQF